jgi:MtN3 and saliva related transmembrane protein
MAAPNWLIDAFGVAAGVCSMTSFVPQIVKIVRERDAAGVSLAMYGVTILGFCCWVTYGLLRGVWPVALSNGVCVALTVVIFALRLKFGDDSPKQ